MSIAMGSVVANLDHIKDITKQIQKTTDCAALELLVKEHLKSLIDHIDGIGDEMKDQLQKIIPIMTIPSPDPFSIVKWISKLVFGTALPQYKAYIMYAMMIIMYIQAMQDLIAAISSAAPKISACAIALEKKYVNRIEKSTLGQIENALNSITSYIAQVEYSIKALGNTSTLLSAIESSAISGALGIPADQGQAAVNAIKAGQLPPTVIATGLAKDSQGNPSLSGSLAIASTVSANGDSTITSPTDPNFSPSVNYLTTFHDPVVAEVQRILTSSFQDVFDRSSNTVSSALTQIQTTHDTLQSIMGPSLSVSFDTSSPTNFFNSVTSNYDIYMEQVDQFRTSNTQYDVASGYMYLGN